MFELGISREAQTHGGGASGSIFETLIEIELRLCSVSEQMYVHDFNNTKTYDYLSAESLPVTVLSQADKTQLLVKTSCLSSSAILRTSTAFSALWLLQTVKS